jgi:hypothetical protein
MALAQQQHQQGAAKAAAFKAAALQEEVSGSVLEAQQLERYSSFVAFMAVQHNWKARALAARISRQGPMNTGPTTGFEDDTRAQFIRLHVAY